MSKRIEPELPSIMPDLDQVKDFKQSQAPSNHKAPAFDKSETVNHQPAKSSNAALWLCIVSIIGFSVGGYTLHQQNLKTQAKLFASEQRILELERALSATGEEMGESAGAIKAKLNAITERTDELWTQMDKLWASAWRRNQSEIKKLREQTTALENSQSQQNKTQSNTASSIKSLSDNQADMTLKLSLLQEQLDQAQSIKGQLTALSADIDKLKSQAQTRDSKQLEIGGSIAQLEMTQSALVEQLERLETKLASAPTKSQSQQALN
ncbi:hypothetical protein C1E24_06815 [Pseudoalteromonas phenolica]|uniref:Chromosome segregation ATPase n=1 Tax=Pseudoalteromonas phenolica TaxID=161398 RepID=A0A5R9Q5N2_9GAMM|nr:hypothetical protein [Pseudoalteromonas phenolica]TLX47942.1 hypothetical protein C1E24_06815 [Pseudoalteromonas phenolica]